MTVRDCQQLRFCAEKSKYFTWRKIYHLLLCAVTLPAIRWTEPLLIPGRIWWSLRRVWGCPLGGLGSIKLMDILMLPSGILNSILECVEWVSLIQTTLTPPPPLPSSSLSRESGLSGIILYLPSPSLSRACQTSSISSWVATALSRQSLSRGLTVVIWQDEGRSLASILS